MKHLILFDEVLLALCWIIAIFIVEQLSRSKGNGLKKILIWYFMIEVYIYFGAGLYIIFYPNAPLVPYIPFVIPKVIIKVIFYNYVKHQNYDRRTSNSPRGSID